MFGRRVQTSGKSFFSFLSKCLTFHNIVVFIVHFSRIAKMAQPFLSRNILPSSRFYYFLIIIFFQFGLKNVYPLIYQLDSAAFTDYVRTSFKYSVLLLLLFLPAASFLNAALCWSICVWILNKSPKRHLPHGFLFRSIHSPPFYACM